ncbi:hypothetical protein KKY_240 [Pelagibacterium halotolerans B2]|uniref:Uncharacterized protein n=1 Tax=Pelagibacterium halotolerans (strain DSM 22347 / JCM 15775 / CGMCC 1.7692 / B2) TaxID=1082931 RepID=G4R7Z0_PELHB|nr:hypothetical protein KKY_240 [Pelagibacterium halotolerans B2]
MVLIELEFRNRCAGCAGRRWRKWWPSRTGAERISIREHRKRRRTPFAAAPHRTGGASRPSRGRHI